MVSTTVQCFTVDIALTGRVYWISSVSGALCSDLGCEEEATVVQTCEKLDVTEATFAFTNGSGKVTVRPRLNSNYHVPPFVIEKGRELFDSAPKTTLGLILAVVALVLVCVNGFLSEPYRRTSLGYSRGRSHRVRETGASLPFTICKPHDTRFAETLHASLRGTRGEL